MATRSTLAYTDTDTAIFLMEGSSELLVGFVAAEGTVYRLHLGRAYPVGHTTPDGRLYQHTAHEAREAGSFSAAGAVYSVGLLEGGPVGWLDPDGVVVQGGLIFGEEEVGRVEGPQRPAAAAALLLIFLPEQAEANRRANR